MAGTPFHMKEQPVDCCRDVENSKSGLQAHRARVQNPSTLSMPVIWILFQSSWKGTEGLQEKDQCPHQVQVLDKQVLTARMLIRELESEVQLGQLRPQDALPPLCNPKLFIPQPSSGVIPAAQSFLAWPDGVIAPPSVLLCDLCVALRASTTAQGNDVFACLSHGLTRRAL